MHTFGRIALATLLVGTLACDDDGPAAPGSTGYDVTVSGDVAARVRGSAWFGSDTDESGAPIFGVVLGQDTSSHTIVFAKEGAAAPAPGEYRIRTPGTGGTGWDAVYILADDDALSGIMVADSGRITITESSPTRLAGRIDLYASGFLDGADDDLASVRISGTFAASPAPAAAAAARTYISPRF